MNIFGTFEHSIEVEQALAILENEILPLEQILVVPLTESPGSPPHMGRTNSVSSNAFEVGMASATGAAAIGACAGFVLSWGPILWGLIAACLGFATGYLIYWLSRKDAYGPRRRGKVPQLLIVAQCTKEQALQVKTVMWKYKALSVGLSREDDPGT